MNEFINHILHLNEIYLSLDATSVVDMFAILTHCDVASNSTKCQKPASSRCKSHVSTMANSFFCVNAVDSRRGLYYELDWQAHQKRSLQRAKGDDVQWGFRCSVGRSWLSPSKNVGQGTSTGRGNADTESGAGSDGEYSDESASETSSHADFSDPGSADVNPPDPPQTPSRKHK
jgi:origin recognition complex subunit 1